MKWLKRKLASWLLKDVEIEELAVRKLKIGESTVTIDANSITLPSLTADPTLAEGKLWYRADLDRLQYAIDTATKREIPYGTINVDAHASRHAYGGADAIPAGGIARSQLEYPTVDVNFAYLALINKVVYGSGNVYGYTVLTRDSFTDKTVWAGVQVNAYPSVIGRYQDRNNSYSSTYNPSASTSDHALHKCSAGTYTTLATEAIDIDTSGRGLAIVCSGSVIKSLRYEISTYLDPLALPTPNATISATDTSFASGLYGFRPLCQTYPHGGCDSASAWLKAPLSPLPPALGVLEVNLEGSGKPEDPYRPLSSRNLAEITSLTGLPDFLYAEAKKYSILKAKGFTDDEIKAVFGYIPQHQVDLDSVTLGVFELHPDKAPTAIVTITADNPYKSGAILRQIDFAKGKNLRVFSPPRDYREAVELYNQLERDYNHWIAGKDNFAYQTLGHEIFDWMQNVDFYYGELLEHKTHYNQLKQVSDREMTGRLNELIDKLSRETALVNERDKHIDKAKEILKKGW